MATTKQRATPTLDDVDTALRAVYECLQRDVRVAEIVDWLAARGFDASYGTVKNRMRANNRAKAIGTAWRPL